MTLHPKDQSETRMNPLEHCNPLQYLAEVKLDYMTEVNLDSPQRTNCWLV